MTLVEGLRQRRDFAAVYRQGRRYRSDALILRTLRTDAKVSRVGLTVGKALGNAVTRNRVKRRLREDYRSLQRDGVTCDAPGTFGENLLIEGLDFRGLRAGERLAVGPRVVLEIHDVREPCDTLKSLDARFPELMVGRSGFVCRVVRGGELEPGQAVSLVERD